MWALKKKQLNFNIQQKDNIDRSRNILLHVVSFYKEYQAFCVPIQRKFCSYFGPKEIVLFVA
jgi:hypothetical protein